LPGALFDNSIGESQGKPENESAEGLRLLVAGSWRLDAEAFSAFAYSLPA